MHVRMRTAAIRPGGESLQPGQVVDVEERLGQAWVDEGAADAVDKPSSKKAGGERPQPQAPTTETQQAPNTTTTRKPKKTESE